MDSEVTSTLIEPANFIRAINIIKKYDPNYSVLDGLNISIPKGKM
jgi:hypothetical protein